MARPSQQLDQALLRSGRALYAELGAPGLSQRRLAEHAGVSPGMFHYHFASKDAFLRALLQQLYEEMFAGLTADTAPAGSALERLGSGLFGIARFVREQRPLLMRLALDAANGVAVAREFVAANVPRHMALLAGLLAEAQRRGELPPTRHPLQRVAFLLGAVVAPMVVLPAMGALGVPLPGPALGTQVSGDAAIRRRIRVALAALPQIVEHA
ncbi:TetR/AcrR family transcriptional regulator [Aquabacterium sp.]|uniref:TetR/AcrR family transcriptional regulator n=1 Tax=Aquabacterium sp. TaxID=1872578 RepID=UPI0037836756